MSDYNLRSDSGPRDRLQTGGSGAGFWILVAGFAILLLVVLLFLGGGGAGDDTGNDTGPDPAPSGVAAPDIAAPPGLAGADDPNTDAAVPPEAAPGMQ